MVNEHTEQMDEQSLNESDPEMNNKQRKSEVEQTLAKSDDLRYPHADEIYGDES